MGVRNGMSPWGNSDPRFHLYMGYGMKRYDYISVVLSSLCWVDFFQSVQAYTVQKIEQQVVEAIKLVQYRELEVQMNPSVLFVDTCVTHI